MATPDEIHADLVAAEAAIQKAVNKCHAMGRSLFDYGKANKIGMYANAEINELIGSTIGHVGTASGRIAELHKALAELDPSPQPRGPGDK